LLFNENESNGMVIRAASPSLYTPDTIEGRKGCSNERMLGVDEVVVENVELPAREWHSAQRHLLPIQKGFGEKACGKV
jgi:hypothetical protein